MPKYTIAFAHFGAKLGHEVVDWYVEAYHKACGHAEVEAVVSQSLVGTPITMLRNCAVANAKKADADVLCMFDDDMVPDAYVEDGAPPFFAVALPFVLTDLSRTIAVPYCMGGPEERVNVFEWDTDRNAESQATLRAISRRDSQKRCGIQEVAAVGTGLILYGMRAFDKLTQPYYRYEYLDSSMEEIIATEDVVCSRNMSIAGSKQYVAWDCWAGHAKTMIISRPYFPTLDDMRGIVKGLKDG